MAKETLYELAVKEYSDDEVINSVFNIMKMGDTMLSKAVDDQNIGYAGEARQIYLQGFRLLQHLQEKKNGKNPRTVVQ